MREEEEVEGQGGEQVNFGSDSISVVERGEGEGGEDEGKSREELVM